MINQKKSFKIMGMELKYFIVFAAIVLGAAYLGALPNGIGAIMIFTIVLGAIFGTIGDNLPIVKDYFGGGSVVIIFGCAALATYGLIPEKIVGEVGEFFTGKGNFIDFALATLISGSILGTNKTILKKASVRFIPALVGAQLAVIIVAAIVALVTGYDVKEAVLFIGIPITAGGMSAGAIPLSQIYEGTLGVPADQTLSIMAPAIALANAVAIIFAGIVSNFAKNRPNLTGYGQIMPLKKNDLEEEKESFISSYGQLGMGFLISFGFLLLARILSKFFPMFHAYAYMVVIAVIVKITGILPEKYEQSSVVFYQAVISVIKNLLLACIGIVLIDLKEVAALISPSFLLIVIVADVAAFFGAAIVGKLVGLYPVESGLSAGLCAADMGGSGDLGILGAANRMELLPFAAIATRIGGAIILIIAGLLSGLIA